MTIPCNMIQDHAGIDWTDPDPEAGFTVLQIACGKPAMFGDRHYAGSGDNTLACSDCYYSMPEADRIDFNLLKPEFLS